MQGDFSRLTFRPDAHYSAVYAQQGRVQLDADANEQAAIRLHRQRRLTADLVGQHGGPDGAAGFEIGHRPGGNGRSREGEPADLTIGEGRYYVDGILVDASRPDPPDVVPGDDAGPGDDSEQQAPGTWTYWDQPYAHRSPDNGDDELPEQLPYLVYLKVWERLVTAVQDPRIRESALGMTMPDTAVRAQVVWQVLPLRVHAGDEDPTTAFERWVAEQRPASRLAARAERPGRSEEDPCIAAPDAGYRGPENQLYRVEIHHGGAAGAATFTWSRDNASVTFPITSVGGAWVSLAALGRDDKLALAVGDWVEVVDDAYALRGGVAPLLQVEEVDTPGRRVKLSAEPGTGVGRDAELHPFLRRWDHRAPRGRGAPKLADGAIKIKEGTWLDLEDGVQVWFEPGGEYRAGDYWLVPARTLAGEVEWERDAQDRPVLAPPSGVRYHYAPLAWLNGEEVRDLRRIFRPVASPVGGTGPSSGR